MKITVWPGSCYIQGESFRKVHSDGDLKEGSSLMIDSQQRDKSLIRRPSGRARGFTLIEVMIVLLIGSILTAMAIPQVRSGIYRYRLQGAVASSTWAIQSTRYQSLRDGIQYQVVFTKATNSYQIQSSTDGGATFTNVTGTSAVPLSGSATVLNQNTTLRFKPNGFVSAPVGALNFTLTYQGLCQKVTVSNYANITLSIIGPTCS
jgi:prepilin-type N-terminal cleavage/methylation domain-containing protein